MSALACALALAFAGAEPRVVEVAFVPDAPELPPLVVRVVQQGAARSLAWVIPGDAPAGGQLVDARGSTRSLLTLPETPAGAALMDDGGVLALSVENAGDWARRYAAPPGSAGKTRVAGVAVAGERALRLVVPALGAPPGPASLVGANLRVAGRGVALAGASEARALVRVGVEGSVVTVGAVDAIEACGRSIPASFAAERPALRLLGVGAPGCAGSLAAVRVTGARLGGRADAPASGVVIVAAP